MKIPPRLAVLLTLCLGVSPAARGEVLDSIGEYGNAAASNGTSGAGTARGFTSASATEYTITAGGTDFWGTSDNGSMIYDADQVQSGDFSAIVRSVSVAGDPLEAIAGEWGRSGLMARKNPTAGNSANVMMIRKTTLGTGIPGTVIGGRPSDGAGTDRGPNNDGEFFNSAENNANGSVRNTPLWLGLHRLSGTYYATWAPDVAGSPGVWSAPIERPGTVDTQGDVYVGLVHQSHNINPVVNTAAFEAFDVGPFDAAYGEYTITYTGDIVFNGNDVILTASKSELGDPVPRDVDWEVRFYGADVPTVGSLKADIYLQGNGGTLAAFDTMSAGVPDGTTAIERIRWASNAYTTTNAAGVNLFAAAVPGQFGGNQENYGVNMTGEIFIPSDADRGGVEQVLFHDGVDDYCLLQVDGVTLIDNNQWSNLAGTGNNGGTQASFDCSDPKYNDGEWVSFRMGTWEGGGGDDALLVWDALDRTGLDMNTGAVDAVQMSYLGGPLGVGAQISFDHDPNFSDDVPKENFRSPAPGLTDTESGMGQPSNFQLATAIPVGTRFLELYLDGEFFSRVPVQPTVFDADFTAHSEATIVLEDVGTGGTADIDETTLTVLRDGVQVFPMITKAGGLTTIVDTFSSEPAPFTQFVYTVSGKTTVATGAVDFELGASATSFAIISELRPGLMGATNATIGWDVMEFTGVTLGGTAQGYRDAQFAIRDGVPAATAVVPYINQADPESNAAGGGDWIPDSPQITNTAGADDNYVTYARTMVTIPMGAEGLYTLRIRGDDGYGLRINGADVVSVAGSAVNQVDLRDASVFFPNFTGDSNAFAVFNVPAAGDYLVEFFGFEGGGGSYQEISWAAGALTAIQQSANWALLGDTSAITPSTFISVWGAIPDVVIPALPAMNPGGWGSHMWYGATNGAGQMVNDLGQTLAFLRDSDPSAVPPSTFTSDFLGVLPELNHSDGGQNFGQFNPTAAFPDEPNVGQGNDDRIALLAHGLIVAPTDGLYTIQIRSDDGFLFRFVNPGDQFTAINGGGTLHMSASNEIFFPAGTGDSNTRATVFLTAGSHEALFVWWEGGGGSHFEISSAPGDTLTNGGGAPTYALVSSTPSATHLYLGLNLPDPIRITDFVYDQGTQMFSLTWTSEADRIYGVYYSQDLLTPAFQADIDDSVLSGGASTMFMFQHPFYDPMNPGNPLPVDLFFRVQDNGMAAP